MIPVDSSLPEPTGDEMLTASVPRLLLGVHAGVYLVPRLPFTLARLWLAFAGREPAVASDEFIGFGTSDASYRPWYAKLARDVRRVGRRGIVWNDAYGLPLNQRFYNNFATYWLYGRVGARGAALASILTYLIALLALFVWRGAPWFGVVTALVLLGSPLFLGSQLHRGKPEMLWWGAMPLMLFAALSGRPFMAGALFSFMAFVNFSVAFFAGLTLVGVLLAAAISGSPAVGAAAPALALGMLPGVAKTALRLVPFVRRGFLPKLLKEQDDATQPADVPTSRWRALIAPSFVLHLLLLTAALVLAASEHRAFWLVLLGFAVLAQAASQSLLYVADPQSFWIWQITLVAVLLVAQPSWLGLVGLVLFVYPHPAQAGFPPSERVATGGSVGDRLRHRARWVFDELRSFPALRPLTRSQLTAPLEAFFRPLPDGSRVLLEMYPDDRTLGGLRALITLSEEILPRRNIELLPDEYVRVDTPRHFRRHGTFNEMSGDAELLELPRVVGASYAVAFTPPFVARLARLGYEIVGRLPLSSLDPAVLAVIQQSAERTLVLLQHPRPGGLIEPPARVTVAANRISWPARAGVRYVLRYALQPHLHAYQGALELPLDAEPAGPASDLRFAAVTAVRDGELRVEYREGWL